MRIDSHQHFWKYDANRDSWIDDSMKILRKDFLPSDLEPLLQENNIEACIAVQADQSEEETKYLLKLADENDFIKGVIGWVDLKKWDLEERLTFFCKNKKFKGVRHILQDEANDFVFNNKFQKGISILNKFNLVYEILICPAQLINIISLVNDFPNQIFVLDHMAKPNIKDQKIDTWQKDITTLAKADNVYCKISGMVTEAHWKDWKPEDFKPYLDIIFASFSVDRLLFGSDWPVSLLAADYGEVLKIIKDYMNFFSDEDKNKIFFKNAVRVYQLEN